MTWLRVFLNNHVLANLTFVLVLALGVISYLIMPRAREPEINFNWINISTVFPGASAIDVERRITEPLEDAIRSSVKDLRFVTSTSRDSVSNILARFEQIDERTFDKRVIDLRREVQNKYTDELPEEADDPYVFEVTTSNSFPTATIVVTSAGDDENLRVNTRNVQKDMERIKGVDRITLLGMSEPELHVAFSPERLEGIGITPADLSDTVRAYFQDISAGDVVTDEGQWIVRVAGTSNDGDLLGEFPVVTANGVVALSSLADIYRSSEEASSIVRFNSQPAALLSVTKDSRANVFDLIDTINEYIKEKNALSDKTGVTLSLVDDQTSAAKEALNLMQNNAIIGLVMVLLVTFIFLGSRIALLTVIGIPFTLAGTFYVLSVMGMTINNTVLLGVVISLGMLVDDAVVVVESIYYRLQGGMEVMDAAIDSLREVFAPVTTSIMTTIAAFLPLMLLTGIMGDFMRVIPIVVTVSLLISLAEAYWILPSHVIVAGISFREKKKTQLMRENMTHWIRIGYVRFLLKAFRYPLASAAMIVLVFCMASYMLLTDKIRFNFFEADPLRIFYVSLEMPRGATLEETMAKLQEIEHEALQQVQPDELRGTVAFAGQMWTETEPLFADRLGQVMISLNPAKSDSRNVNEVADEVLAAVSNIQGVGNITLLRMNSGPPAGRDIEVKLRGDNFDTISVAAEKLRKILDEHEYFSNVSHDFQPGNPEMVLRYNGEAIKRTGVDPRIINRSLRAFVDGEMVSFYQDEGEEVTVRVINKDKDWQSIDELLRQNISLPGGRSVALGELMEPEYKLGQQNIRHYNFRRAITLVADVDKEKIDVVQGSDIVLDEWNKIKFDYPNIDIEFSGILDDIEESLEEMRFLFILGLGLMYIILGTQFRSYFQPLMILVTVPLAFTGVVLGLIVTRNPMSLYTLYGVIALAGISVNAAIVLISAANDRLGRGMGLLHATIYAARRRVVPILITSLTTIAGLFSLAAGLAGESLVWGPVATAIVWGLAFSTVLTLIIIPLLYRTFMGYSFRVKETPSHS